MAMLKRCSLLLLALLVSSSCYFPSDFKADLQIDRQGRYRFTYVGKLTDLSMAQRLAKGELQGIDLQKRIAIAERDLRRDRAFKKIEYEEQARFSVAYQREGNILVDKSFNFVRLNARFLTLKYDRTTGKITVEGGKPNEQHADALEEAGLRFNGTLRVWTNAQVEKHNSKKVRPQGKLTVYTWDIENVRQQVPTTDTTFWSVNAFDPPRLLVLLVTFTSMTEQPSPSSWHNSSA